MAKKILLSIVFFGIVLFPASGGGFPVAEAQGAETAAFCTATTFTRNLFLVRSGADVRALQQFLNAGGFAVAATGAGSPGKETSYFGPATRAAVIRFQKANSIAPAVGYFGPLTRA